ncbi:hypothetical protein GIB67_008553 [Kingdonia uniflora]|uniref:Uncharacterized protein n=1 Tax=Kingdonia uniflora TaxID=39325 RepID=A0A7J7N435_9MAGN|nr:hypothetical protein GIB67_008553 [Kingdonia uniflora]
MSFYMYLAAGNTLNFHSGCIISKSYFVVLNGVHPDSCSQVAALQCEINYVNQYFLQFTIFMGLLQAHIKLLESTPENRTALLMGLEYVCLDYWNCLVTELFEANHSTGGLQMPLLSGMVDGI